MQQITVRRFLKDFEAVLKQAQINVALKLAKGQCVTMEQYARQVGQSEGMTLALGTAREMLAQMEAADQNEDLPEMEAEA